jgi:cell division transport system permease protein
MLTRIKRITKTGWKEFSRNLGLSMATVFIMIMVISLVTILFLLKPASDILISEVEKKVDVSVYLKEDVNTDQIMNLKSELSKIPEVKEINYVSKEEALEIFIEIHKDDPVLIESLTEVGYNPFLASLNIKAWEASQYEQVTNFLQSDSFQSLIEKVDYYQRKPVIEKVFGLANGVNKIGLFLGLIFGVIAVLISFNTVRIAIYGSKEEISIMRLVGASNWFVRGPFLVQGIIVGFIAALITLLIAFISSYFLSPKIISLAPEINLWEIFINNLIILFLIQLATGVGLGIISSYIAVRKYLKI